MAPDALEHYDHLLRQEQWLWEGFCWTVIGPFRVPVTPTDVMTRLSAGAIPEVRKINVREGSGLYLYPINIFFVLRTGEHLSVINVGSQPTYYREYCNWLSRGTHLRSVTWQVNGYDRFTCAVDGEIALDLPEGFCREISYGSDPEAFSDELAPLYQIPETDVIRQRAAAMAILDERSGFRLTHQWLHSEQVAVLVDQPIPQGVEPHSVSASVDPNLHSEMQSASPARRRTALLRLVERLADRFQLEWSSLQAAYSAISQGEGIDAELRDSLMDETLQLSFSWQEGPANTPADNPLWLRWQAGIAVRLALVSAARDSRNLETLRAARNALGEDWPETRQYLLELLRRPPQNVI